MRVPEMLGSIGFPQPHASSARDTWQPNPDPVTTAFILLLLFGIPILAFFWLGLGELHDWWQVRGWRAKQDRQKLK